MKKILILFFVVALLALYVSIPREGLAEKIKEVLQNNRGRHSLAYNREVF
jgi:hypothetical protein